MSDDIWPMKSQCISKSFAIKDITLDKISPFNQIPPAATQIVINDNFPAFLRKCFAAMTTNIARTASYKHFSRH